MTEKKSAKQATKTAHPAAERAHDEAESAREDRGMPAYAKDGKVICLFRADKYMTFGPSDKANHALARPHLNHRDQSTATKR